MSNLAQPYQLCSVRAVATLFQYNQPVPLIKQPLRLQF